MRRTLRNAAVAVTAGVAVALASCSMRPRGERLPETGASLEGTVSYGGEKVPFALIIVVGEKASATGKVGEDGHYKLENVPLGEVKVAVNTNAAKGDYQSQAMSRSYKGPDAKGKARAELPKFVDVPPKYLDPATSGLKTTVQAGPNTFDIAIPR